MSKKKDEKKFFNLGDTEFQRKISIYYSWVAPVIFFILAVGILIDRAYLTGVIILLLSIFLLPLLKKFTSRLPKILRVIISLGLIALAFYSMNLYV